MATNFGLSMGLDEKTNNEAIQSMGAFTLLNRVALPEEIAKLAIFLASDDAVNITGAIMMNDAGFSIK